MVKLTAQEEVALELRVSQVHYHHLLGHEVEVTMVRNALSRRFGAPGLPKLNTSQEWSCPEVGDILKRENVPDWPLLATYLISEASMKDSSRWINYISALPRQPYSLLYCASILFQTPSELDRYLEASQIRERAIERIDGVTGTYNDLRRRIFSKYPDLFPERPESLGRGCELLKRTRKEYLFQKKA